MKTPYRVLLIVLLFCAVKSAVACSTFLLKDKEGNTYFGRNFDFPAAMGHIHINPRGLTKTSFAVGNEKPLTWTSRFGSVSFNQNGREFPYGGMNETGLVIEQMWHQDARYPDHDQRYGLTELQWIQYQLDNAATVEDVLKSDSLLRISNASVATLHFLVSDAKGNVAAIEYIDGKMNVHHGETLPNSVLTNCSYENSLNYSTQKQTNPRKVFDPSTENSSGRFLKATQMIDAYDNSNPVDYSFSILDSIAQGPGTVWSIVYDIRNHRIFFKTQGNKEMRKLQLNQFNFSCDTPWLMADIDEASLENEKFTSYSFERNFAIIDEVCNKVMFLNQIPAEHRRMTALYPETLKCR